MKINQKLIGRMMVIGILAALFLIPVIFIPMESSNSTNPIITDLNDNGNHTQGFPEASIRTINCTINLISITPNPVYQGVNTTLYGHIQKFNGTTMINASGETVYPIIGGKPNKNVTTSTDINGYFWLSIPVGSNFDIFNNISIQANTTNPDLETSCTNTLYLDALGKIRIDILNATDQFPAISYQTQPYANFTNYHITGKVTYLNGTNYIGSSLSLNYAFGSNSDNATINTNPDGTFDYNTWLRQGFTYYTISYSGNPNLSGATNSSDFKILKGIHVDFSNTSKSVYQGTSYLIQGKVVSSTNSSFVLNDQTGSLFTITFMGRSINVTTDNQGRFSTNLNVSSSATTGNQTLSIKLIQYNGVTVNKTGYNAYITVQVKTPNPFDPNSPNSFSFEIVIIIIIAVAGVIGIIFFQRWRINHQANLDRSRLYSEVIAKLKNVHILIDSGRIKEAMVYLSIIYTELAQTKFSLEKKFSQTLRDFCIIMVTEFGQNPVNIYAFLQNVEKIVYGGYTPTRDLYNTVEQQFGRLFMDLTGEESAPTI